MNLEILKSKMGNKLGCCDCQNTNGEMGEFNASGKSHEKLASFGSTTSKPLRYEP